MAFDATEENSARARLIRLRDHIAGLPEALFSYRESWPPGFAANIGAADCQTPVCILGWARVHRRRQGAGDLDSTGISSWLGLSEQQGHDLFFEAPAPHSAITRDQAVRAMDILIATGRVDWTRALAEAPTEPMAASR